MGPQRGGTGPASPEAGFVGKGLLPHNATPQGPLLPVLLSVPYQQLPEKDLLRGHTQRQPEPIVRQAASACANLGEEAHGVSREEGLPHWLPTALHLVLCFVRALQQN